MKKLEIDWFYVRMLLSLFLVMILAFYAGKAAQERSECASVIAGAEALVKECNQKIRECNNIPPEFNVSGVNLTWIKTTTPTTS